MDNYKEEDIALKAKIVYQTVNFNSDDKSSFNRDENKNGEIL